MKRISAAVALLALGLAGCNAAKPSSDLSPILPESLITGPYQFEFIQPPSEGSDGFDTVYEANVQSVGAGTDCAGADPDGCHNFFASGISFSACTSNQASQQPPTGCVTVADVSTFLQEPFGLSGVANDATGQVSITGYPGTSTQTANGFSGTWSQGGVSGTWFATKAITFPAAATFTASEGQWTMSVSGTTATLSNPDTSYNCTVVANSLVCPYPGETSVQSDANFIVIPDSTVPSGFDLAWIGDGNSAGFIELLTDQN
jgi:hypothetical protein